MGASVIRGKAAFAFVADNGDIFYLLTSEGWGKKDGERYASWCAQSFGRLPTALKYVFRGAASCEGGDLQGPSGRIRPKSYLKGWRTELANPALLEIDEVSAAFGTYFETKWRDPINEIMGRHGLDPVDKEVRLNIKSHGHVLEEILQLEHDDYPWRVSPWVFFQKGARRGDEQSFAEVAGYQPARTKAALPEVILWKLQDRPEHEFFRVKDAHMDCMGWAYSTVGSLIANEALQSELTNPGSGEDAINQINELVASAIEFDDSTVFVISRPDDKWKASYFTQIAKATGQPESAEVIEVTARQVVEGDVASRLRYVPVTIKAGESSPHQTSDQAA